MRKRIIAVVLAGLMVFSTGCSTNVSVDPETGVVALDGVPVNELLEGADLDALGGTDAGETTEADAPAEDGEQPLPLQVKDGVDVVAVFADGKAQQLDLPKAPEGDEDNALKIDTIWIFYSDNTFDQYAESPQGYEIYSTGTYSFKDGGDFIIGDEEDGTIVFTRKKKALNGKPGLVDYDNTFENEIGSLGFESLYGPGDEGKEVEAIWADDNQLMYVKDGVTYHLDAFWIMFTDKTFKQYALIDDDIKLYSSGTYEFGEDGDFHFIGFEENSGTITLTYDYNILHEALGDKEVEPVTYDIKSLGLSCLFEKMPEELPDVPEVSEVSKDAGDSEESEESEGAEESAE